MKIVSPNTTEVVDIKIIPRKDAQSVEVVIHNEDTKEATTYNIATTYLSNYMVLSDVFLFAENGQYSMEVFDGSDLIYRDKIFCTSQDVSKYNINAERFVQANKSATTYKF
jgi:hypothetical protein|tara:strand:+ start:501 stop:833 length:333 start_codon:yes stop_codon:yes gene_type:complete